VLFCGDYKYVRLKNGILIIAIDKQGEKEIIIIGKTEQIKKINSGKDSVLEVIDSDLFIRLSYSVDFLFTYIGVYKISSGADVWRMEVSDVKYLFTEEKTYLVRGSFIEIISSDSGAKNGSFDLNLLGTFQDGATKKKIQVMHFCGVHKNTLVVTMTNGGILLLDTLTGKPVQFFIDAQMRLNLNIAEDKSSLYYGFNHTTFIEIDVEKREVIRKLNIEKILLDSIDSKILKFVNYSIVQDGLIYFIAGNDTVGFFDPVIEKIIWKYKFEFEQKGTILKAESKGLQVYEDSLYVLDTAGDLHIFQKS